MKPGPTPTPKKSVPFTIRCALLLILAAGLYLFTLDNGLRPDELTGGDLITHQYAQAEARPSNAPGYPLYTMGGWLWFRLGSALFGWLLNPIQILSLYSTLWSLASLLILYLILLQLRPAHWSLAWLLTAFYAVTFFFWYYSVTTEQYTSAVFQTLLLIWLAFKWDEQPRDALLLWLAFVSGTLLANMMTTLFILPPLLWFILFRPIGAGKTGLALSHYLKKPKLTGLSLGLALLPLLSYAYIYIRGAQHPEWRGAGDWPTPWAWFIHFLTIPQGRAELAPGLQWQPFFTTEFPALIWRELTWPICLAGLLGLLFLGRRRAIFLSTTLLIYLIFCWLYRFGNWFQVIIPAYPIFIIGALATLNHLISPLPPPPAPLPFHASEPAKSPKGRRSALAAEAKAPSGRFTFYVLRFTFHISHFILILLLIYRFATNLPQANQRNLPTDTGLDPGWAILADQPTPPALISADFAERLALQYLTTVWQAAPAIYPTAAGDFTPPIPVGQDAILSTAGWGQDAILSYISRRGLAAAPHALALAARQTSTGQVHPQAAGQELIALPPEPQTHLPATAIPLHLNFGDKLKLAGWEQIKATYPLPAQVAQRLPQANWRIALYWQTSQPLHGDYTISVRPLVNGQLITGGAEPLIQDHQPIWGAYPTSRWQPGELIRDTYALTLPAQTIPTAIHIIVYQATTTGFVNLAEQTIQLRDDQDFN